MGCGGSKEIEEGLEGELDDNMQETGVETVDAIFKDLSGAIAALEGIRAVIIDERVDTIIQTGACSHIKPDIQQCFKGFLLKISVDNGGNFIDARFEVDLDGKNFLKITGEKNSNEAKQAINSFTSYLKGIWEIKDKAEAIYDKVKGISDKITNSADTLTSDIQNALASNPFSAASAVSKLLKNISKVKNLAVQGPKIPKELVATLDCLKGFPALIKDVKFIAEINEQAKKAIEAKKTHHPYQITYFTYEAQSRYGSLEDDGYKLWMKKGDSKKAKKAKKTKAVEKK